MTPLQQAYEAVREAVYAENSRGGEARSIVLRIARLVGVDLASDVRGDDLWSTENMERVVEAVREFAA